MLRQPTSAPLVVRSLDELQLAMRSVPYKRGCVACDNSVKLECPKCPAGQACQFTVPVDCTQCPHSTCMPDESSAPAPASNNNSGAKDGPSAGPIAAGVIGGVVLAVVTFLVWKFFVKPKRSQSMYGGGASMTGHDSEKDNTSRLTRRSSTHMVHSIASIVLTRASNIIQIAYIPGVTNRATPTSPTVLVPPVPPIPMHHSAAGAAGRESCRDDQHFFVPGNLRNSTYSGISAFTDRASFAPRSSIASTIYGRQAQIQTPAQTVMRAKPTVVSVRGAGTASSSSSSSNVSPIAPRSRVCQEVMFCSSGGYSMRPESSVPRASTAVATPPHLFPPPRRAWRARRIARNWLIVGRGRQATWLAGG